MGEPGAYDDLTPFEAQSAPRNVPLAYPGVWPPDSVVVADKRMWKVTDRDGATLAWEKTPPVRLGACRVRSVRAADRQDASALHLNRLAEQQHCALIDARAPVLAIGSNAAPSQLRHKFRDRPEALFIPSIRARIGGVAVGYTSFVSQFGYIPATVHPDADSEVVLAVQFLDDRQIAELDESESPYYRRVWLDARQGVTVVLETGEELAGVYAYVAEGGVRVDEAGKPIRMQMPGTPGLSQAEVLEAPTGLDLPDNPFFGLTDEMGTVPRRYGSLPPVGDVEAPRKQNPDELADELLTWVAASPDGIDRGGKSVVRLNRDDMAKLGNPPLVSIRSARLAARYGSAAPAALAAVHPYDLRPTRQNRRVGTSRSTTCCGWAAASSAGTSRRCAPPASTGSAHSTGCSASRRI